MARPRKNAPKKIRAPKAPKMPKVPGIMVNVHHHHYAPRIPAARTVHRFGPAGREVVNVRPVAPTAVPAIGNPPARPTPVGPMRPRPVPPTNSGLRFSGNPNAFRFGGGNRGPQTGGLGGAGNDGLI